ncbi:MAG: hypothetical protein EHM60_11470, partial [Lysobacterales bacterium]
MGRARGARAPHRGAAGRTAARGARRTAPAAPRQPALGTRLRVQAAALEGAPGAPRNGRRAGAGPRAARARRRGGHRGAAVDRRIRGAGRGTGRPHERPAAPHRPGRGRAGARARERRRRRARGAEGPARELRDAGAVRARRALRQRRRGRRRAVSRRVALAVLACLAVAHAAEAGRKSKEPATLAELAKRTAPVTGSPIVDAVPAQAAQGYEAFLAIEGADPALRAQALRRLGDLRLAEADAGAAAGDEVTAAGDAARAIEAYQRLLAEQPDYAGTDAVLYQLARAREITGDAAGAMATLDRLVASHSGSAHYAEAQFRRGESFFSAQRYADAERAYGAVLAQDRDTAFHQQSRYKLGWSLFKQSRDEESSAAFLQLLDEVLVADGRLRSVASLSRPEQEISDDALRALAITFAAAEGPATLQLAVARHGATVYESRLYQALGDLYVEKERYQDGAEAYRAFARARPMDREAPPLLVRATEAYAKGGFTSLVL